MPTPPTTFVSIFPSTAGYVWGVPTAETGLMLDSVTHNVKTKKYEQHNQQGETVGVVTYDPTADVTISGETTAAFTWIAGQPIVLANVISIGGVSGGLTICESIDVSQSRTKMQSVKVKAMMYPLIPAA